MTRSTDNPNFSSTLTPSEREIIDLEVSNLKTLISLSPGQKFIENRQAVLDQMFSLRTEIDCANEDDIPQLTDQLTRLTALVNQGDRSSVTGIDSENPYFGHMGLKEGEKYRDIYLGSRVFSTPDGQMQIVDWKTSPISKIYFKYDQGEEYEEEFAERMFEGTVFFKRTLKIVAGQLVKIQQEGLVMARRGDGTWERISSDNLFMTGGAGTAARPENTRTVKPELGIGLNASQNHDKLLAEITGLIDPEQFDLITQPETGIIAIQGAAGSGKTTVALHRIAWLHFQDKQRFDPKKMMIMVFNKALATYISKVLPSLGVRGTQIDYFENWVSVIRKQIFGSLLPAQNSESTPVNVIRFKKHPVVLGLINEHLDAKREKFQTAFKSLLREKGLLDFPAATLCGLPFVECLHTLINWINGNRKLKGEYYKYGAEFGSRVMRLINDVSDAELSRKGMVLQFWEDFFTDDASLRAEISDRAGDDFTESQFQEIGNWLKHQYILRQGFSSKDDDAQYSHEKATLDYEDESILILFYQKLIGNRISNKASFPRFSHLMVDEAQDLSPLELSILMNVCRPPKSITLAGDVNQKLIEHNGFDSWETVFKHLGIKGQQASALNVSYRSTHEIMNFAVSVLGDLSTAGEVNTTRHGPEVELFKFSNPGEQAHFIASTLKNLIFNEPNASVALICISATDAAYYFSVLEPMDIPKLRWVQDQEFTFTAGIDVTDIKQVKGLEFDYVLLLDVDSVNYPGNKYSKYLLHIGATRASHQLWIANYRVPSPLLPPTLIERL